MPSYHLRTSDGNEEKHTGKHVELISARGSSTETTHFITKRKITLIHTDICRGPDSSLCHKDYQKHDETNLYNNFGPHKHRSNMQATTQYVSPEYVEVPQLMGSLNTCIICITYVARC